MPNPTVDNLTAELSNALERWFDRCQKAIETVRNGNYPFDQFARDVTETWVDGTYVSLLPVSLLGGVTVTLNQPFPVVRFNLFTKADTSRMVLVPILPSVTMIAAENLQDASKVNSIPAAGSITLTKASATYVKVALANLGPLTIPAGFYKGNIIGQPMNTPIARIEVVFP